MDRLFTLCCVEAIEFQKLTLINVQLGSEQNSEVLYLCHLAFPLFFPLATSNYRLYLNFLDLF